MHGSDTHAGWSGTIGSFLAEPESRIRDELRGFVSALVLPVGDAQVRAWNESIKLLKLECAELTRHRVEAQDWGLIFEYELPRERGRRPDIVILTGCSINVVEFKGRSYAEQVDLDQVAAYGRDLTEYHGGSHDLKVNRIVSLDATLTDPQLIDDVWVVGGKMLGSCLQQLADNPPCEAPDIVRWLRSDYQPIPSLVAAARRIFDNEPLPQIRSALSAGIPQALESLQHAAVSAKERGERHISLVTGVPGAGKTLVGLNFVYNTRFTNNEGERPAVFLSGNGPLVAVLQDALKSRVFVQDVHNFLMQYGGSAKRRPEEHIWVYDEAQRAWDADKVKGKRDHDLSEHQDFVNLGMRMPDWAMLVGLIGEGQEIHLGEEGGLQLWNEAIAKSGGRWVIHCPSHIAHLFPDQEVVVDDVLNLSTSLRSHVAGELHEWVGELLQGHLLKAEMLSRSIRGAHFNLYVTRDLADAKQYVRARYADDPDKRYGLLASSKAKILPSFGVDASWQATRRMRPARWYNDAPTALGSCCQLLTVATEFQCQGLELDFPIVCWDKDLVWRAGLWESLVGRSAAKDPHQLRLNSYRVLLTRGRDGMVIYVPPIDALNATHEALIQAGCESLALGVSLR